MPVFHIPCLLLLSLQCSKSNLLINHEQLRKSAVWTHRCLGILIAIKKLLETRCLTNWWEEQGRVFLRVHQVLECSKLQFTFQGQGALLPGHYPAQPKLLRPCNQRVPSAKQHIRCTQTKLTVAHLRNMVWVLMQLWWRTLYPSEGKAQSDLALVRESGHLARTLKMGGSL